MNKEKTLEGIENLIQEGNNVLKTKYNSSLNIIFSHFYKVARQLRCRYNNRETLKIEDEYDVQDLLHALLIDIRCIQIAKD